MIKLNNILCPVDFSPHSLEALEYACSLAEKYNSTLHIFHVALGPNVVITYAMTQELPEQRELRQRDSLEKNLKNLPTEKMSKPKSVVHKIIEGIPLLEVLDYTKHNPIDLIVMGTHGHTGLKHLVMGSVAENVVRKSTVPVLTVQTIHNSD